MGAEKSTVLGKPTYMLIDVITRFFFLISKGSKGLMGLHCVLAEIFPCILTGTYFAVLIPHYFSGKSQAKENQFTLSIFAN